MAGVSQATQAELDPVDSANQSIPHPRMTGRAALVVPAASRLLRAPASRREGSTPASRGFAAAAAAALPDHTVVGLPALSPTMTHGNLAQWHKKVREGIFVCVCCR